MSTTAGGDDEEYAEWELVWAKAAAKGDWWPCQKCEVGQLWEGIGLSRMRGVHDSRMMGGRVYGPGV